MAYVIKCDKMPFCDIYHMNLWQYGYQKNRIDQTDQPQESRLVQLKYLFTKNEKKLKLIPIKTRSDNIFSPKPQPPPTRNSTLLNIA